MIKSYQIDDDFQTKWHFHRGQRGLKNGDETTVKNDSNYVVNAGDLTSVFPLISYVFCVMKLDWKYIKFEVENAYF